MHCRLHNGFCEQHRNLTIQDWSVVIFCNESKFNLFCSDGVVYVQSNQNEEHSEQYVVPTVKFAWGTIRLWAAMSARNTGILPTVTCNPNGDRYIDSLDKGFVPSAHLLGYNNHFFFMAMTHHTTGPRLWHTGRRRMTSGPWSDLPGALTSIRLKICRETWW